MKKTLKVCLIVALVFVAISILLYIPIWQDDAASRRNRKEVHGLINVGQDLSEAEVVLKHSGFKLEHDKPITPTINGDHLSQMVIIGDTRPNGFETFAYTAGLTWMPFTHSESSYVIIDADLNGKITRIR